MTENSVSYETVQVNAPYEPSPAEYEGLLDASDFGTGEQVSDVKNEVDAAPVEAVSEDMQAQPPTEQPAQEERQSAPPKRIAQLLEQKKAAELKAMEKEKELLTHQTALQLMQEELQKAQARLSELEYVDPRDIKLQDLERQNVLAQKQAELEKHFSERQRQYELSVMADTLATKIADEAFSALAKYPALSKEEMAFLLQNNPGKSPMALAQQHDAQKRAVYEKEFSAKYRAHAPTPTKPSGGKTIATSGDTLEDMASIMRSEFGDNWMD